MKKIIIVVLMMVIMLLIMNSVFSYTLVKDKTILNNASSFMAFKTGNVVFDNGNILIPFTDTGSIAKFVIVDEDGEIVVSETQLSSYQVYIQSLLTIKLPNNNAIIGYDNSSGGLNHCLFAVVDSSGSILESDISTTETSCTDSHMASLSNGNFVYTYKETANEMGVMELYNSSYDLIKVNYLNEGGTQMLSTDSRVSLWATPFGNDNYMVMYRNTNERVLFDIYNSSGDILVNRSNAEMGVVAITQNTGVTLSTGNVRINYWNATESGVFRIYDSSGNELSMGIFFDTQQRNGVSRLMVDNNILTGIANDSDGNKKTYLISDTAGTILRTLAEVTTQGIGQTADTILDNGNILTSFRDTGVDNYGKFVIWNSSEVIPNTPPETPTILYPTESLQINGTSYLTGITFPADADDDSIDIYYYINDTYTSTQNGNYTINHGAYGNYKLSVSLFDGTNFSANASVNYEMYNGTEEAEIPETPTGYTTLEDDAVYSATSTIITAGIILAVLIILLVGTYQDMKGKGAKK